MPLELEKTRWNSEPSPPIGKRGCHPRLKDRIALHDRVALRVETWPVERMRHLAYQPPNCVARQPRVRV